MVTGMVGESRYVWYKPVTTGTTAFVPRLVGAPAVPVAAAAAAAVVVAAAAAAAVVVVVVVLFDIEVY